MDDETLLSASSVNTYLRCAKQWEYAYVYLLKRPPRLRAVIGIAAHSAVEANYRQKIESRTDLPVADVQSVFSDQYDRLAADVEDPEEDPGEAKDNGIRVIAEYQKHVAFQTQPAFVEEQVTYEINGIPYSGIIDLVDDHDRLRDLKTTARKPNGATSYSVNMVGYALGLRAKHGIIESDVILDYMVRTKIPYHYPVSTGGRITDAQIRTFSYVITKVSEGIRSGVFPPTGLQSGACSWCGYRDICPAIGESDGG